MARKSFILLRQSVLLIQSVCRGHLARLKYDGMRREASALKIQRNLLMHLAIKAYNRVRSELRFMKQTRAAIIIQSHYRNYLAAITKQCACRGKITLEELLALKKAAKQTGSLQASNYRLERQIEELTCRLQLETRTRADLEEQKTQENLKLQLALQDEHLFIYIIYLSILFVHRIVQQQRSAAPFQPFYSELHNHI
ncbi:hypothetical protein POM88_007799 [Heracleum sosnowskyi]|uniref:Uncharacterized protein n=1 Tax=Heracleum sosnowskyi TaxID=360622 RepID=A0AAD8N6S9_9APIA|nr:hypothetical protein POM88_007799 [Heracleum sosnowskyi]